MRIFSGRTPPREPPSRTENLTPIAVGPEPGEPVSRREQGNLPLTLKQGNLPAIRAQGNLPLTCGTAWVAFRSLAGTARCFCWAFPLRADRSDRKIWTQLAVEPPRDPPAETAHGGGLVANQHGTRSSGRAPKSSGAFVAPDFSGDRGGLRLTPPTEKSGKPRHRAGYPQIGHPQS